jgi:hypothetical protein
VDTTNIAQISSLLLSWAIALSVLAGLVWILLGYAWWIGKIQFWALVASGIVMSVIIVVVLVVIAVTNKIPLTEVWKVLFWFNSRR